MAELDPSSSKYQVKKAKVQGRIVCLCWGIDEPTYPLVKLDTRIIYSTLIASLGLNESLYRFLDAVEV